MLHPGRGDLVGRMRAVLGVEPGATVLQLARPPQDGHVIGERGPGKLRPLRGEVVVPGRDLREWSVAESIGGVAEPGRDLRPHETTAAAVVLRALVDRGQAGPQPMAAWEHGRPTVLAGSTQSCRPVAERIQAEVAGPRVIE